MIWKLYLEANKSYKLAPPRQSFFTPVSINLEASRISCLCSKTVSYFFGSKNPPQPVGRENDAVIFGRIKRFLWHWLSKEELVERGSADSRTDGSINVHDSCVESDVSFSVDVETVMRQISATLVQISLRQLNQPCQFRFRSLQSYRDNQNFITPFNSGRHHQTVEV
jgi:hypothetical protein